MENLKSALKVSLYVNSRPEISITETRFLIDEHGVVMVTLLDIDPAKVEKIVNGEAQLKIENWISKKLFSPFIIALGQQEVVLKRGSSEANTLLKDILYISTAAGDSLFVTETGEELLSGKSLVFFDSVFPMELFFKISSSNSVNRMHIKSFKRKGRIGEVTMCDGEELTVSKSNLTAFREWYNKDI